MGLGSPGERGRAEREEKKEFAGPSQERDTSKRVKVCR